MKTETIDKLCASYMEDARGIKRNMPNREIGCGIIAIAEQQDKDEFVPKGWEGV